MTKILLVEDDLRIVRSGSPEIRVVQIAVILAVQGFQMREQAQNVS